MEHAYKGFQSINFVEETIILIYFKSLDADGSIYDQLMPLY